MRALGQELRRARKEAGLTQVEVAKKTKIDRSFISDVERGVATPSLQTLFALCKALRVAPSDVIRRVEKSAT